MTNFFKYCYLTISFFYCYLAAGYSQPGHPYITNISLQHAIDNQVFSISQGINGDMFFTNRSGILHYDGQEWDLIVCTGLPVSLSSPVNSKIFVGCENNAGFIEKDNKGVFKFHQIIDPSDSLKKNFEGYFSKILTIDSSVFFCSDKGIIEVNKYNNKIINYLFDTKYQNSGIFSFKNTIYINIRGKGLHYYHNKYFLPSDTSSSIKNKRIIFSFKYDSNNQLVGTGKDIYLFDGRKLEKFHLKDSVLFQSEIISDGIEYNDSLFVLSTYSNGCLIINKKTGKTLHYINNETGLPDDEIFSIMVDNMNGIWISHSLGISRLNITFPILAFHTYKGISNSYLFSLFQADSSIYVGTSSGLYTLKRKLYYEKHKTIHTIKKKVYITKKKKIKPAQPKAPATNISQQTSENKSVTTIKENNKIVNFFKKLFQEKTEPQAQIKPEETTKKTSETTEIVDVSHPKTKEFYIKEERIDSVLKKLKNIDYEFVKTGKINKKIAHIEEIDNHKFICNSNSDIFLMYNDSAIILLKNKYILDISVTPDKEHLYALTSDGIYYTSLIGFPVNECRKISETENLYTLNAIDGMNLWAGGNDAVYRILIGVDSAMLLYRHNFNNEIPEKIRVKQVGKNTYFLTQNGLYTFLNDNIIKDTTSFSDSESSINHGFRYITSQKDYLWFFSGNKWHVISNNNDIDNQILTYLNLFTNIVDIYVCSKGNIWLIDNNNSLYCININQIKNYTTDFFIDLKGIYDSKGDLITRENIILEYDKNSLRMVISAPFYLKSSSTTYSYFVDGLMKKWSDWTTSNHIQIPFIPPGKYKIFVKAKNIFGKVKETESIDIEILKPFWQTNQFIIISVLVFLALIFGTISYRERNLLKAQRILEEKVKERTFEIEAQKNKIATQNKSLKDSIEYAKRIQQALLPKILPLKQNSKEYFILFKPRDIVSGDFYWTSLIDNYLVIAAVDCTGHGVPGAFMSMLGISFLNEIVNRERISDSALILEKLRYNVVLNLGQENSRESIKDGMDMALCVVNTKTLDAYFSGAYNPLYHVIKNTRTDIVVDPNDSKSVIHEHYTLLQYPVDKMPIGISHKSGSFSTYKFKILPGETIYLLTDGFVDQIGGPDNKKFMPRKLKQTILEMQDYPLTVQNSILEDAHNEWKGSVDQVDDILLIGVKF